MGWIINVTQPIVLSIGIFNRKTAINQKSFDIKTSLSQTIILLETVFITTKNSGALGDTMV